MKTREHAMHGVFHSNGFGHLLWINGSGSGSDLPGYRVMDLWERLCTGIRARKVSLCGVLRKRGMELRLLHGLAYGEPWFGHWGYQFCRGSFSVTLPVYETVVEAIQTMPLALLMINLGNTSCEFPYIFPRYQPLSDQGLMTLGSLFRFIIDLMSRLPEERHFNCYNEGILLENSCRWSRKRVDLAIWVIVKALRKADFRWVSRQEVRDAAHAYIGDRGLLDFILKSLGNHMVGRKQLGRK